MTKKKKQTLKFTYNYFDDPKDKRTDTYVGEIKDGIMHGKGKYTTDTGSKYVGTFKKGKIFKGTWFFYSLDEDTNWEQTGTFKIVLDEKTKTRDFEIVGIGTMKQTTYFLNKYDKNNKWLTKEECHPLDAEEVVYDFYKGTFIHGSNIHGKGEQTLYSDKKFSKKISSYKGNFNDYGLEGDGEYTRYDENNKWLSKLTGKFKNNNITKGKLIMKFPEGNMEYNGELKGSWSKDILSAMPHGKGVKKISSPKSKSYSISKGFWIEASQNGEGRHAYFKDKNFTNRLHEYKGGFKDNNRHGFGTLIKYEKNKKYKYVGNWKKDKEHGIGKAFLPNGDTYEGDFKNGSITGNGIFKWTNGESYEGKFKDGYKHGLGVMTYKSKKYKSKSQVMVKYQKGKLKKVLGKI